jgi:hypothetical protein
VAEAQDVLSRARTQRSLVHARGCAEAARSEEAVQRGVKKLDLRDSVRKDKVMAVFFSSAFISALHTKIDTPRGCGAEGCEEARPEGLGREGEGNGRPF